MGKIQETIISRFDGGITNDPRDPASNVARMVANFDVINHPHKMVPYRESEAGHDSTSSTSRGLQNFAVALRSGNYVLYALGEQDGNAKSEVEYKALTTGAATDLDDDDWASPSGGDQSGGSISQFNLFVWYHKTLKLYMARDSQYIWTHAPPSTADTTALDLTSFTNIAQGLVHSKDDILYIPYDNKIAKNDNGSWTNAALTLPTHLYITSICEYGNYLAIGCASLNVVGHSVVYLWDRNSSLTTLSESINWGVGTLQILDVVDGTLIGISRSAGTTPILYERIYFRAYNGSYAEVFKVLDITDGGSSAASTLPIAKQKFDNRLFFLMDVTLDGIQRAGLWSIGRNKLGQFTLVLERTVNNDTALSTGAMYNFIIVGDYTFIAYDDSAGDDQVSKTNDSASYTATSIYESKIFNAGDSSLKKDLMGVTVTTEAMPANGQIVLKYQINENIGDGTWTTIFTNTTDDSVSYSVPKQSGLLPTEYKEIAFRIESTGGAIITGLSFEEEVTGKRNY